MTEPPLLRAATFAVPLSGNKGSASMLLGLRDACRDAGVDARFAVFSYYPRRDAAVAAALSGVAVHPGHPRHLALLLPLLLLARAAPALVPRRFRGAVAALRESDVALLVGGTTFADSMLYKVPWNVLAALPALLLGKPVVFLSQTLGPMEGPCNRALARWVLGRAAEVHGRGRASREWARRIGLAEARYRPDLSFSLAVPDFAALAARHPWVSRLAREVLAGPRLAVGVVPNSIVLAKARQAGFDYPGFLAGAVAALHERGFHPVLLPHCYREDRRAHNNDRALCAEVLRRLPAGVPCFYLDADLEAAELRAVIGRFHLLVASRFHSMVSALAMGVPPLTWGWGGHKYREVLEELGVPELYAGYRELDAAGFAARLAWADGRREELAATIRSRLAAVRADAGRLPLELLAVAERARAAAAAATARPAVPPSAPGISIPGY